jgi:oxygen-independent coproporphyrinogen-3 oxidase
LIGTAVFTSLPPLSLYVHLPWCVRKCPYCDFNSYESKGDFREGDYVDALLRDLDDELPLVRHRPFDSIFVGGGTPSLFSGTAVRRLLDGVRARVELPRGTEITLEANPGAIEAQRFAEFREAGVTRLSIGIQSFRDPQLALLGRVHDSAEAIRAVGIARGAGFESINLDLMYGLPDDDVPGSLSDLAMALDLAPEHLSWYQLTLEPNTSFHRRPPLLPEDDTVAEIEAAGRAMLTRHGYERYEVSAYAKPGRRCVHNLSYWQFGDYLGLGAGAHGKITAPAEGAILRRAKTRNPRTYMQRAGTPEASAVERIEDPEQIVLEFMMNALRLPDGIRIGCFEARTGVSAARIEAPLRLAVERGWMKIDDDVLKPTPAGLQVLNSLLILF